MTATPLISLHIIHRLAGTGKRGVTWTDLQQILADHTVLLLVMPSFANNTKASLVTTMNGNKVTPVVNSVISKVFISLISGVDQNIHGSC